jgi:hypothetical protein
MMAGAVWLLDQTRSFDGRRLIHIVQIILNEIVDRMFAIYSTIRQVS